MVLRQSAAVHGGRLRIGKHRGRLVEDLAATRDGRSYLLWLLSQDWLDPHSQFEIEQHLDVDQPDGTDDAPDDGDDGPSAATAFPFVVWRWANGMRATYADDPFALSVVEDGAARLRDLCSEVTGRPWPGGAEDAA